LKEEGDMTLKRLMAIGAMLFSIFFTGTFSAAGETDLERLFSAPLRDKDVAIFFLSYSGVIIRTLSGTIVIDPSNLLIDHDIPVLKKNKVNVLLFTHGHGDHFDAKTALLIARETSATIVAEPSVASALQKAGGIPPDKLIAASAGRSVRVGDLTIQSVAGKHIGPIMLFRVQAGPVSFFHGGDSAYVPVRDCPADIAFLPTGDPSPTASPEDAVKMALDVHPQVAVLMHGAEAQHADFKRISAAKLPDVIVEIPEPFKTRILSLH
jgi:L-ascorbate metabolism protein UlaG (beta-lactamase superfamily)